MSTGTEPKLRWFPIPAYVGLAWLATLHLTHMLERDSEDAEQSAGDKGTDGHRGSLVRMYASLPLRSVSRIWGNINSFELPLGARKPVYSTYSYLFGCNLAEMKEPNLLTFTNLGEFFYRKLKDGARPLASALDASVVCPADGTVLTCGVVQRGAVEQIKGITYSLDALLGKKNQASGMHIHDTSTMHKTLEIASSQTMHNIRDTQAGSNIVQEINNNSEQNVENMENDHPSYQAKEGNRIFSAVIYLAPGDYHRFHSPTEWKLKTLRHFCGELFSVSPFMAKYIPDLFVLNERVAMLGQWKHGLFSMVAVGATNVGSIVINSAAHLKTNRPSQQISTRGTFLEDQHPVGLDVSRGDELGGFKLGSTVVLVFEAPESFKFSVEPGKKVKYGQAMGK